jgi:hypothetical protein
MTTPYDLVVRSRRVVLPGGEGLAAVVVRECVVADHGARLGAFGESDLGDVRPDEVPR